MLENVRGHANAHRISLNLIRLRERVFEDDLGCKPFECQTETEGSQGQLRCSCEGVDHLGQLTTSPDTQYYLLSY